MHDQVKRVRWFLKTNKAANTKSKELSAELRVRWFLKTNKAANTKSKELSAELRGLTQSSFDSASAKNLVIVKGIIDVKQLIPYLKIKRTVEVVPAKTE
ncbi:hypothetical protein F2Q68_00042776 [Brassica cretica]|uniref:HMA domain-containing protein n=1 Tax=Brassica cretica TaxID=69181 RepID=A0A8S9MHV6_BRACR|nr:hypothetical protein F2Q68_00042776 [Brassica cretica]